MAAAGNNGVMIHCESPSAAWISARRLQHRLDASFYSAEYLPLDSQLDRMPTESVVPLREILKNPRRVLYQNTTSYDQGCKPPKAVPFISGVDLDSTTLCINWDSVRFVDGWMADRYPKGRLFSGALLIKVKGPNQSAVYVEHCPNRALVSGTIFFAGVRKADPYYVAAYLASRPGTRWRTRLRTNITVEFVGNDELREVPIFLPDEAIQRAIGNKVRKAERLRELAMREKRRRGIEIASAFGELHEIASSCGGWVSAASVNSMRLDAWFNQPASVQLASDLSSRNLIPVSKLATLATDTAEFDSDTFDYYEISDIGAQAGVIHSQQTSTADRASRAKYAVRAGDILVSTVRPNRKGIAVVPDHVLAAVCSSGFAVLRAADTATAYYIHACLLHDLATQQLMRWNTGAAYPAIERNVPIRVLIPRLGQELIQEIGASLHEAANSLALSSDLIVQAKSAVESLIDGTLDEERVLAESVEIEAWLKKNPSPLETSRPQSRREDGDS